MTSSTTTTASRPVATGTGSRRRRSHVSLWFAVPALAVYAVVVLYPVASGVYLAFTDWNGLSATRAFTGLENLRTFLGDGDAMGALIHQLIIATVFPLIQNVVGLALAVALNSRIKSRYVLRTVFFAPAVMTPIIIAFLWQYIYSTDGTLNTVLGAVGLDGLRQSWLGDPDLALWSIIAVIIWQFTGYAMVIYLAGLQAIPGELLEAAQIDGAGRVTTFVRVVIPLLAPSITINVVLSTIMGLKIFDQVYAMTGGGPGNATQTLTGYQYQQAFTLGNFGYGTTVALVLAAIVSVVAALQYKVLRRNERAAS
ncbi:carbohydrate ABC transporter permease [Jiangella mangrovi]|uniref:Raffinose/stachyose/melibiose transport system permease protein n=1 Tax=Jiangella mangrovi TaxID=1524084 RepID=A0A7W9LM10_9ACTN|nr:sugar ABC transporter permease [Jiangella mangrovi]MBB5788741.1 raffinose/stachyose/melibiose transport system permease protein [Jiangella mangrovi]